MPFTDGGEMNDESTKEVRIVEDTVVRTDSDGKHQLILRGKTISGDPFVTVVGLTSWKIFTLMALLWTKLAWLKIRKTARFYWHKAVGK